MDRHLCEEMEDLIMEYHSDKYYVLNYGYYLHVFTNSGDNMIMVLHGYGTEYEPYELKLIKVDDDTTVIKHFYSKRDLKNYIKNKLSDELMVLKL